MEHFVVSARKYRPQTFKDVVGQQAITNTLLNAINNNHLAQALLFTGPRGVGKTTCARILAKMINHDGTQKPDEDFAFNIFELDAASNNSVDDIRNLIDQVRIPPQIGKYKVYIIDEVHMLSASAFNAFLKTLEEPPKHAIFILATTEKHKIIPTILSRCQIFDFKRITVTDAKNYLGYIAEQEGVKAEDDALHIIAQKADGAMRDALSIYDRVVSFSGANLTRQAVTENLNVLDYETYLTVTGLILKNNIPQLLVEFNDILSRGFDGHHFISGLASHFRDLLVCRDPKTVSLLEVGETTKTAYFEQAQKTSESFLMQGIDLANECDLKYKSSRNQRLLVELCLMQLASVTFDGEKKKPEFIIPAENFKNAVVVPPTVKLSAEEKVVVRDNEYATGNSAASPEVQVPDLKNFKPSVNPAATKGLPDPENASCNPEPKAPGIPVEMKEALAELLSDQTEDISGVSESPAVEEESETLSQDDTSNKNHVKNSAEAFEQPALFIPSKVEETDIEEEPSGAYIRTNPDSAEEEATYKPEDAAVSPQQNSSENPGITLTPSAEEENPVNKHTLENKDPEAISTDEVSSEENNPIPSSSEEKDQEISTEKVSGLSLKSIRLKKEILAKQQGSKEKAAEVRSEKFTETQLHAAWDDYIHRLKNKGEKILASIMETDMPKINGSVISIELPADTMKKDLERGQNQLMGYLKKRLDNTLITLEIQVNETTAKKYAFTNIEKYNKLKEKNPLIEKLRSTFDLDL